jgi:hypothetical protein
MASRILYMNNRIFRILSDEFFNIGWHQQHNNIRGIFIAPDRHKSSPGMIIPLASHTIGSEKSA